MKISCTPVRGSSFCFMREQALQLISTRYAMNCLKREAMSSWFCQEAHPWSNISDERYNRSDIWDQALVPAPTLPSPTNWARIKTSNIWGRIKTSNIYKLLWTMLLEVDKVCQDLCSANARRSPVYNAHTSVCLWQGVLSELNSQT